MTLNNKKGFTIIEVVIVLAIAGLIFAIVFWALPNLQKNQRDNERRNIVGNVLANLDQYAANSNGRYPTSNAEFETFLEFFYDCPSSWTFTEGSAVDAACSLQDPLEGPFAVTFHEVGGTAATAIGTGDAIGTMYVSMDTSCGAAVGTVNTGAGDRAVAAQVRLENGVVFCQDNS